MPGISREEILVVFADRVEPVPDARTQGRAFQAQALLGELLVVPQPLVHLLLRGVVFLEQLPVLALDRVVRVNGLRGGPGDVGRQVGGSRRRAGAGQGLDNARTRQIGPTGGPQRKHETQQAAGHRSTAGAPGASRRAGRSGRHSDRTVEHGLTVAQPAARTILESAAGPGRGTRQATVGLPMKEERPPNESPFCCSLLREGG